MQQVGSSPTLGTDQNLFFTPVIPTDWASYGYECSTVDLGVGVTAVEPRLSMNLPSAVDDARTRPILDRQPGCPRNNSSFPAPSISCRQQQDPLTLPAPSSSSNGCNSKYSQYSDWMLGFMSWSEKHTMQQQELLRHTNRFKQTASNIHWTSPGNGTSIGTGSLTWCYE